MTGVENEDVPADAGKQVIARAAAVLRTLENRPAGLNLSQIARGSGLPRTTVSRLVGALAAQQFLFVDGTGRVRLGPALARLAATAQADLTATLRPHLETLARETGETVHLWALAEGEIVLVDQIVAAHEVRVVLPIGARLPLACTAGGKAILAGLDEAEVRRLVDGRFSAHTANSPLSVEALLPQLEAVRRTGVARDHEEHADDVRAIGIAVPGARADRLALSVAAPTRRFKTEAERLELALRAARDRIAAESGP
jgi:IclR family transcriptional regulator, acetate operon repressor